LGIDVASRYASAVVIAPANPPLVLVVEDDRVNQMLLAEVCRNEGYDVLTANDGEAALELFFDREIDVLLVDAAMPRMDGFTLCRLVRGLSNVPVIMVTASLEAGARARAMEAGVSAFVSKPFRIYELTRHIRAALSERTSPSEPPSGRAHRRLFAQVLDRLGTSLRLRAGLSRSLRKKGASACLVLRLENEDEVVAQVGRTARDALLGFAGHGLEHSLGDTPLYWAESNELAVVVPLDGLDDLIEGVGNVLEEVRGFGIEGVQFRYGAVRFVASERLDADKVLRAARDALEEAGRQGEQGRVNDLDAPHDSAPP
jgi:two-component system, OmpR family, response regulator